MLHPNSEIFIVAIAPDGSRSAYRIKAVEFQVKNDYSYSDHIFMPSPVVGISNPPTLVEVSGVLVDGRAWTPGAPMKEML